MHDVVTNNTEFSKQATEKVDPDFLMQLMKALPQGSLSEEATTEPFQKCNPQGPEEQQEMQRKRGQADVVNCKLPFADDRRRKVLC